MESKGKLWIVVPRFWMTLGVVLLLAAMGLTYHNDQNRADQVLAKKVGLPAPVIAQNFNRAANSNLLGEAQILAEVNIAQSVLRSFGEDGSARHYLLAPVFAVSLGGMHRALTVSGGPSSRLHRPVPRSAATAIAKPIAALVLDLEGRPMRPTKAELFGMTTVGRGFNGDLVLVSGVAFSGTLWAKGPTQGQVENAAREAFGLAGGTGLPLIAPYVSQRSALGGADMTEARNLLASVAIVSLLFGATLIVGGISGRGSRHLATRERKPSQTASGSSTRYFDPLLPQDEIQQSEDHQRMSSQLDFRALSRLRSRL